MASLAGRYDGAILDLWGVLHDGERPIPGTIDCLAELRSAGWRLILLSNAPRRAAPVVAQVAEIGIPRDAYDGLVTSGDLTRAALADRGDAWHVALGPRFYHLGPERDWGLLDGLPYERTDAHQDCDFILNTGLFDDEAETAETYSGFLGEALAAGVPMICANPDREILRGERRIPCAGAVAQAYEAMGGPVRYHGKPDRGAYDACFALMPGVDEKRIVAVGDAMVTDIAGAAAAGIHSVFVLSGIDGGGFGADDLGQLPDPARLDALAAASGAVPTAAMRAFVW